MKKIITSLLILSIFIGISYAQKTKVAYINANKVLQDMPELKSAEEIFQKYVNQLSKHVETKQKEYESKRKTFEEKQAEMSDLIKQDKIKELQNIEKEIKEFQIKAQEDINKKQNELYKPIKDKLLKVITEVAKENSFTSVIDNSGGLVLYHDDKSDIEALVRKKLGLSTN